MGKVLFNIFLQAKNHFPVVYNMLADINHKNKIAIVTPKHLGTGIKLMEPPGIIGKFLVRLFMCISDISIP